MAGGESTDDDERLALLIEEFPQQAEDLLDVHAVPVYFGPRDRS